MERREIWIANLPELISGHEQTGTRPFVLLAMEVGMVIGIPFTSNLGALRFPYTFSVSPARHNGLIAESVALIFQIGALDASRLQRKIGIMENSHMNKVNELLRQMLKL